MKEKKKTSEKNIITISKKQYKVAFDMQTMMNFEEITDESFFTVNLEQPSLKHRMALIIAAVLSADKESDLTVEMLTGNCDWQAVKDVLTAFGTVIMLSTKFFGIPEIEKQNEPEHTADETDDDKPKN